MLVKAFDIAAEDGKTRNRLRTCTGRAESALGTASRRGWCHIYHRACRRLGHHQKIEQSIRKKRPYDRGLAALVSDIYDRGRDKDILVVSLGEFGRTPRINKNAGRNHWADL